MAVSGGADRSSEGENGTQGAVGAGDAEVEQLVGSYVLGRSAWIPKVALIYYKI
jgi:hypothetical protein